MTNSIQNYSYESTVDTRSNLPRQEVGADQALEKLLEPARKATISERLMHELKEMGLIVGYLAISLTILQTYKSLILLQQGINDFQHNYIFALVAAVALGKIVAMTQNLPFLKACSRRSLAIAVLYQSVMMTLIIDIGGWIEDMLFPRSAKMLHQSGDPLVLAITHQFAALTIFIILFTVREVDKALGPGKLWKLIFIPPDSKSDASN